MKPYALAKRAANRASAKASVKNRKVEKVMHEYGTGTLRSGSDKGPVVKNRKQAIAIALSEARKAGRRK